VIEFGGGRDDLGFGELADRAQDVALHVGQAVGVGQARHRGVLLIRRR
jgi:hypothetical protein